MSNSNSKDGETIAQQVPAATEETLSWEAPRPGTVTRMQVRVYGGPENTLHLRILKRTQGGTTEKVIGTTGKPYIDGDDDDFPYEIAEPIRQGEEIVVEADNTDGSNAHNYRVNFDVDYASGTERVVSAVKGVFA